MSAIENIHKPASVVVVGSYFGYAAAWIVPNLADGKMACLIDPDKQVCAMAQSNFAVLGLETRVKTIAEDFFKVCASLPDFDHAFIDAYGPKTNAVDFRGKRIYGPIIEQIRPKIVAGGIVAAHNVFYPAALGAMISLVTLQQPLATGKFKPYIEKHFSSTHYVPTENGISISKK